MIAPNTPVGARVRVSIAARGRYAMGCAEALDGLAGAIERFKEDGEALVAFDRAAPTWFSYQTPATAFWFPPGDLAAEAASEALAGG